MAVGMLRVNILFMSLFEVSWSEITEEDFRVKKDDTGISPVLLNVNYILPRTNDSSW